MSTAAKLQPFDAMYREIAALPDGQHGEILGPGWVRTMSRPGGRHARFAKRALRHLGAAESRAGGWWIEMEREIRLGDRLFVPDLAGWRIVNDNLSFVDENPVQRTPDWTCEILSRATQRGDRVVKLPTYAAFGVSHVWIVDVEVETVEVFACGSGKPVLVACVRGPERARLAPFDIEVCPAEFVALAV